MMDGVSNTEEATKRIRKQLRRRILGLSTLTIHRHPVFDEIERSHRQEFIVAIRHEAAERSDFKELAELYEEENESLKIRIERLEADQDNS